MSRPSAEMIPAVTEPPRPNVLPTATTQSPTLASSRFPQVTKGSFRSLSILRREMSVFLSRPITFAVRRLLS
jgi:hypothetical protein